jgi:hypothetical protein
MYIDPSQLRLLISCTVCTLASLGDSRSCRVGSIQSKYNACKRTLSNALAPMPQFLGARVAS